MPVINTRLDPIEQKARSEALRLVTQVSPSSYQRGFIEGARWALKEKENGRDLYQSIP